MYWEDIQYLGCWQLTQMYPSQQLLDALKRDEALCQMLRQSNPMLGGMIDSDSHKNWWD